MASYDLKAILDEKIRRLTDKTLKALVDCMCTVGASLCSLDKRVSALESVELPEGGYKPMQEPVASPSASGTAIQFIEFVSQDATGRMTATKKTVRTGSTSQTGVLQLKGSIAASESADSKAATPKAVRDAINALDVAEVGGTGKYIKAVSEADGKIVATEETMDTTPTEGSQKAVTSGGVKAAIDAIDPGNTGMGEVVAAALNDLDARVRANEEAVFETNLGDRTADRLDVQELLVGGEDVAAKLDGKVDKVEGKGLSTNDFTDAYKGNVDENTSARHSHTNKSLLDNISQSDIDNWNSKQAALSFMTDAEVDALFTAAWNAANA